MPEEVVSQLRLSGAADEFWQRSGASGGIVADDRLTRPRDARRCVRVAADVRRKRETGGKTPEEAVSLATCWSLDQRIPEEVDLGDGRERPGASARPARATAAAAVRRRERCREALGGAGGGPGGGPIRAGGSSSFIRLVVVVVVVGFVSESGPGSGNGRWFLWLGQLRRSPYWRVVTKSGSIMFE